MKEPTLEILFNQLEDCMDNHYKNGKYHLLLADLEVCVCLIKFLDVPLTKRFLENFTKFCIELDKMAHEKRFRNYIRDSFVEPVIKCYEVQQGKISSSLMGKLPWGEYYISLDKHAGFTGTYELLFDIHGENKESLQSDMSEDHKYATLSITVIVHCEIFTKRYSLEPDGKYEAIDKTALFLLGDDLCFLASKSENQAIWHSILILQKRLATTSIKLEASEVCGSSFKSALRIHYIARQLASLKRNDSTCLRYMEEVISLNKELLSDEYTLSCPLILLDSYKEQLKKSREWFANNQISIFDAQKRHTQSVIDLLKKFIDAAVSLLGAPPCDFAFCLLGSSSRYDRRPYSDVELLFLYMPRQNTDCLPKRSEPCVDPEYILFYVFQLIALVEILIICLGETNHKKQQNAGFHIDSSSHILVKKLVSVQVGTLL